MCGDRMRNMARDENDERLRSPRLRQLYFMEIDYAPRDSTLNKRFTQETRQEYNTKVPHFK